MESISFWVKIGYRLILKFVCNTHRTWINDLWISVIKKSNHNRVLNTASLLFKDGAVDTSQKQECLNQWGPHRTKTGAIFFRVPNSTPLSPSVRIIIIKYLLKQWNIYIEKSNARIYASIHCWFFLLFFALVRRYWAAHAKNESKK